MKTPSMRLDGEFQFVPIRRQRSGSAAVLCWRIDILAPGRSFPVADLEWHATPPRRWILFPRRSPLLGVMAKHVGTRWEWPAFFRPRSVPARMRREVVHCIAAWSVRACISDMALEIYAGAEGEAVTA